MGFGELLESLPETVVPLLDFSALVCGVLGPDALHSSEVTLSEPLNVKGNGLGVHLNVIGLNL